MKMFVVYEREDFGLFIKCESNFAQKKKMHKIYDAFFYFNANLVINIASQNIASLYITIVNYDYWIDLLDPSRQNK